MGGPSPASWTVRMGSAAYAQISTGLSYISDTAYISRSSPQTPSPRFAST